MVYFTGDIVDHGVWETSITGNLQSMKFIYGAFNDTFQNMKFFPVIGNHESSPVNVFAPRTANASVSTQWLYDYLAQTYAQWLPDSAIQTVKLGGYYTVLVNADFRIIVLNNNLC